METEISKRVTGLLQHSEQICKLHCADATKKINDECQAYKKGNCH